MKHLLVLKADGSNAAQFAAEESNTGLADSVRLNRSANYRKVALAELDRRGQGHRVSAKVRREVEGL